MKILCILACVLGIMSPTAQACTCDLGLVADTTKSLKDHNVPVLKEALTDLVEMFDISQDKTHVSLETFTGTGEVKNYFNDPNYWSVNAVTYLINTTINKLSSPTRLDRALQKANNDMFTKDHGDRPGVKNALVLFTDGRTNSKTDNSTLQSSIDDLKNKGVLLIAVAIGPDSSREESQKVLKQIAGENVFPVTDPMAMADVFDLICPCKRDLGLVVDTTKSLKEYNVPVLKEALTDLVEMFDISQDKTHVSLETFAGTGEVKNFFNDPNYWSVNAVTYLINTTINKLSSPTRLDRALQKANNDMFTKDHGDRPGVKNALVLFTDGRTNSKTDNSTLQTSIDDLKNKGVLLIAVAIGPDSSREESQKVLKQIAGENVFPVTDPMAMADVFDLICRSPGIGKISAIARTWSEPRMMKDHVLMLRSKPV